LTAIYDRTNFSFIADFCDCFCSGDGNALRCGFHHCMVVASRKQQLKQESIVIFIFYFISCIYHQISSSLISSVIPYSSWWLYDCWSRQMLFTFTNSYAVSEKNNYKTLAWCFII